MNKEEGAKEKTLAYFDGDELATNVFLSKYALRDKDDNLAEETPDDMHFRLAREFARVEQNYPNPMSYDEILDLLLDFKYVVPQGSPMAGIGDDHRLVSLSNCVVIPSPEDSISGIMETGKTLANLAKFRCGTGIDISSLRPEGMKVNNAAKTTSGGWTFAELYSDIVNMIGQNGRRGALMISMDVSHPDIEKFITMKRDLKKVTGANISVKIGDAFMEAVQKGESFPLTWNGKVYREVDAAALFRLIAETARDTAEPGILFWDRIIGDVPLQCYAEDGFDHVGVNPCAELALSANDACRLISINVSSFATLTDGEFDWEKFDYVVRKGARLSDDLIDLEIEKLEKIVATVDEQDIKDTFSALVDSAKRGRRVGLGTHGLADLLIKMRLTYGSPAAITFTEKLYSRFANAAYGESIVMAKERGPFPIWSWDKDNCNSNFIHGLDSDIIDEMKVHGRRNGSMLTCAPAGSVSIVSRTSSGVEPVFAYEYTRRRKLDSNAEVVADFIDDLGVAWKEYTVHHPLYAEWLSMEDGGPNDQAFIVADDVEPLKRIHMQAAMQKGIDHQISSTINLPKGTSAEEVEKIYMDAYLLGLKGITVYVDGSRDGVLLRDGASDATFPQHAAPKRPESMLCKIHHLQVHHEQWTVFVGMLDGKPFEVFGGKSEKISIPKRYEEGMIRKRVRKTTRSKYDLICGTDDDELIVKDIVQAFENPNYLALTRMISLSLRHGASIEYVCDQLNADEGSDMFSFSKSIARVLKRYIPDGTVSSARCPECGERLRYEGGCSQCVVCGFSRCG